MSIIRSAIKSSLCLRPFDPVISRSSLPFLQEWRKCLSTATEQPPSSPSPPSPGGFPIDGLNKPSGSGEDRLYGKFSGFSKHTLKTDIMNVLEGCNVTPEDLKFSYMRSGNLNPAAVYVQFPSRSSYDNAMRAITKKGRLYRLERATHSQWDPITPYDGKVVVLHGIPPNAIIDDIDRFLSGCLYHPGSIQFLTIQELGYPKRVVLVRFTSQIQAMNAYITKNRNFLLNQRIALQVLQ
uniref:RRM domain-containing protein n=1 Tax=Noccaea caerulescens TaxID=107243 RepID=A0A1J3E932_NOCCA